MSAKIKPSLCVIFACVNWFACCFLFLKKSVGVHAANAGDHADAVPVWAGWPEYHGELHQCCPGGPGHGQCLLTSRSLPGTGMLKIKSDDNGQLVHLAGDSPNNNGNL